MKDLLKGLSFVFFIICCIGYLGLNERERELKEVEIIRQAESSQDPYLKEKAERMKREIKEREDALVAQQELKKQREQETNAVLLPFLNKTLPWIGVILCISVIAFGISYTKRATSQKYR